MEDKLEEIKERIQNHENRLTRLEGIVNELRAAKESSIIFPKKKMSFSELLLTKKPQTDKQKVLLAGFYLEKEEGASRFTKEDLERVFKQSKQKPPSNFYREITGNVREGYMIEMEEKKDDIKTWSLTERGIRTVESDFSHDEQ